MRRFPLQRLCGRPAAWGAIAVACAACALLAPGCRGVKGSGNEATQVRKVPRFKAIELAGAVDVHVTAGEAQSLKVSGDDNLVPLVITRVKHGRLRIDTEKPVRPELDLAVDITVADIDSLSVSGTGKLSLRNLENAVLKVDVSGAAELTLSGSTGHAELDLSGAGAVDAKRLRAQTARVTVSGAGAVDVYASEGLTVDLSGAGTIRYYGNPPNLFKHISGVGKLEKR